MQKEFFLLQGVFPLLGLSLQSGNEGVRQTLLFGDEGVH